MADAKELLESAGVDGAAVDELVHGTTVAANAVLEGTGAPTRLLTTRGFRDVLEIRRIRIPVQYDFAWGKPPPLVARERRLAVDERINARGEVERTLDPRQVRRTVEQLLERGAEALAVCLLNSYANPVHEREIGALLDRHFSAIPHTLSTDVVSEIGEYERTSTTVINACLLPLVRAYLGSLRTKLADIGVTGRLLVMQSHGGIAGDRAAATRPAYIVESGPAAGAIAAAALASSIGCSNAIAFDMGGTTAKSTLIERGRLRYTSDYEAGAGMSASSWSTKGGGYALKLPGGRCCRGRRGRRLGGDRRRGRPRHGGAAQRRSRSGASMLRTGRHRADRYRRECRARVPEPGGIAGRCNADRRRARDAGDSRACRSAARLQRRARRVGHSGGRQFDDGACGQGGFHAARARCA